METHMKIGQGAPSNKINLQDLQKKGVHIFLLALKFYAKPA